MNNDSVIMKPWDFFRQLNGRNINLKEKHYLSEHIVGLWLNGNAHNAMECALGVSNHLTRADAKSVLKEVAGELRSQANYVDALKKVGLKP
jgi:hypothetical protein